MDNLLFSLGVLRKTPIGFTFSLVIDEPGSCASVSHLLLLYTHQLILLRYYGTSGSVPVILWDYLDDGYKLEACKACLPA